MRYDMMKGKEILTAGLLNVSKEEKGYQFINRILA